MPESSVDKIPPDEAPLDSLQVVAVDVASEAEDVFGALVVDRPAELIARLREALVPARPGVTRIAVVVAAPADPDPWRAAAAAGLVEAARGIVGALTLERGPSLRLNLVLAEAAGAPEVDDALAFLSGPAAGFTAGATLDLRRTP